MALNRKTHWVFDMPILDWRFGFTHDIVELDGDPYLERWIFWFGMTLRFHKFIRPDAIDRGIHDHPWWFWTWVPNGYYLETRHAEDPEDAMHWHYISGLHYSPPDRCHAIMEVEPGTRTIVLTGFARNRDWGFYDSDGNFTVHDR